MPTVAQILRRRVAGPERGTSNADRRRERIEEARSEDIVGLAGLGGLPVVDESNRIIGMLSERDLLRDLLSH